MVWGIGFYAGFIESNDNLAIAKQLHRLLTHGLLDTAPGSGRSPSSRMHSDETRDAVAWPP
jgi:hypothetical protein